ncbi:AAA family ATPase [Sphingomonas ginsenosidivorax]|uniref:AAA family ATPase n=1 Tax=Sphingomonas ginsenosidivorax TaxID=862135 RepID=A0A5C6UH80_9SPHN|nr:AAA family ATPase [Sphingomonas ginsenosidivorax]TXC71318.1 AAA family ATPase [Sphingomonas ginsenosidivorax]
MELRVVGWRYENVRGGIRDVTVSLDGEPRWTLVQMPNGTGKTTTMTLLRAVLTGADLTPDEVVGLRADDDTEHGLFELRLSIDDKPYRVELELDFVARRATYWTTRAALLAGGREEGWNLPPLLRKLLTPEFTRLFVFDGEFAKEIRAEGRDRTTRAIRTLYRLDQLDQLKSDISKLVALEQAKAASITTAREQKGVTRLQNALSEAERTLSTLRSRLKTLQSEKKTRDARQAEIKGRISERTAQDEKFAARRAKLDAELSSVSSRIAELSATSLAAMRSPTKISPDLLVSLRGLGTRLTTLQLPKTISQEFFHELAHAEFCVCETKIGPKEHDAILAGADKYLAEDQITIINRMKRSVRESVATGDEFAEASKELQTKLRERRSLDQQLEQLQREQVEAGDEELKSLLIEQKQIEVDLERISREAGHLSTTDRQTQLLSRLDWKTNVALCRAEVESCQRKYAAATKTVEFTRSADKITALVDLVAESALDKLRESVRLATNEKLARLVKGEPLRVARIGSALELESSGVSAKGGVSEGQSLSVAYAFITSLLSAAPHKLPFIVDSPAVSLDTRVRREVGEVIPELFDQMIMFVISSEKDGFADAFYPRQDVRYVTIWKDDGDVSQMREGLDEFKRFHAAEPGTVQ